MSTWRKLRLIVMKSVFCKAGADIYKTAWHNTQKYLFLLLNLSPLSKRYSHQPISSITQAKLCPATYVPPPPSCDSLVISKCLLYAYRDGAQDRFTDSWSLNRLQDRFSEWVTESEIDFPIKWPRARSILWSSDRERDWFSDQVTESEIGSPIKWPRARLILQSNDWLRDCDWGCPLRRSIFTALPRTIHRRNAQAWWGWWVFWAKGCQLSLA